MKQMLTLAALSCVYGFAAPGNAARNDDDAVINWIREHAIAVETVEAGNGFDDLQPLKAMIGDARIVALGEATHGTREFFQMKHRLFEFLVEEMGFTVFGIEASYPDCIALNEYVLNSKGDPVAALNGQGFWTWDTEEVLDLVRWMRDYNADRAHTDKLTFYGFDMQNFSSAARVAVDALRPHDAAGADALDTTLAPLMQPGGLQQYQQFTPIERSAITSAIQSLVDAIDTHGDAIVEATSGAHFEVVRQHARIAIQCEEMIRTMASQSATADQMRLQQLVVGLPATIERLQTWLGTVDPDYAAQANAYLEPLRTNTQAVVMELVNATDDELAIEWQRFADGLDMQFEDMSEDWADLTSADDVEDMSDLADDVETTISLLVQHIRRMKNQVNVRDVSMAENVAWIAEQHPEARIAIWAHNLHISKHGPDLGGQTLGSELVQRFGDAYYAIGFAFNQGSFQAIYQSADGQWDGKPALREHTVGLAPTGSLDRTIAHAGFPICIIDNHAGAASDDPAVAAWFTSTHPARSIGALFNPDGAHLFLHPIAPVRHYDCIVFVESTTRARPAPLTRQNFGIAE